MPIKPQIIPKNIIKPEVHSKVIVPKQHLVKGKQTIPAEQKPQIKSSKNVVHQSNKPKSQEEIEEEELRKQKEKMLKKLGLFSKVREIKDQEDAHKPQMDKRIDSKRASDHLSKARPHTEQMSKAKRPSEHDTCNQKMKRQKVDEQKEEVKPIQMYFCKSCNKSHEVGLHAKKYEQKKQEEYNKYCRETLYQQSSRTASSTNFANPAKTSYQNYCDDEEDSSLDGFIVKDDEEPNNAKVASKVIKNIFGHNKYSYADEEDFDDRQMEAKFDDIQREEFISRKIGKKEDELEYKRMIARGELP